MRMPRIAWGFIVGPVDYAFPSSTLVIKADGYAPAIIPDMTMYSSLTNVAQILLEPTK
jgi:hypothetical protein